MVHFSLIEICFVIIALLYNIYISGAIRHFPRQSTKNDINHLKYNKMNLNFNLPLLSSGYAPIVMDANGELYSRVNKLASVKKRKNFLLQGTDDYVVSFKAGKATILPIIVPNNVFTDAQGRSFIRTHVKTEKKDALKAKKAGAGYIIARKGDDGKYTAEAYFGGVAIDFPTELTNECGVTYKFVDFKKYGDICAEIYGYFLAQKVEPVYVSHLANGSSVQSVLNGIKEHDTFIEEGEVLCQNMYHGESYKQKISKLLSGYKYSHTTAEGLEVWNPKAILQKWTYTKENVFGILWGGFEFLAKAMINIENPNDVYGCNYDVFNGNDTSNGSHQKVALFLPVRPQTFSRTSEEVADAKASVEEGVPKVEFVQVPLVMEAYLK